MNEIQQNANPITLQSRLVESAPNLLKKREHDLEIRKEALRKFDNEDRLLEIVNQEDELMKLYQDVQNKQNAIKQKKDQIQQTKLIEIESKKRELHNRLQEIGNDKEVFWDQEKWRVLELRKKKEQSEKLEQENKVDNLMRKKELEIEKMFLKKREMELIQKQKETILNQKRKVNNELNVIKEHKDLIDIDSRKFLEKAQAKGTYLEKHILDKALTQEEQAMLTKDLLDKRVGEELTKQALLDKLQAEKYREMRKNEVLAKEKIKELNDVRMKLTEDEERILREKAVFENVKKRGLDFQTEVELGNAPPMEKLRQNVRIDHLDDYRHKRTKDDVIKLSKLVVDHGAERIQRMNKELQDFKNENDLNDDWKIDLKMFFDNCEPNAFNCAKHAISEQLIKVYQGIDKVENDIYEMSNKRQHLQAKKIKFDKKIEETKQGAAQKQLSMEFLEKKIMLFIQETARETLFVCKEIDEKVAELCCNSIKIEKSIPTSVQDLKLIVQNSEHPKVQAARQAILQQFKESKGKEADNYGDEQKNFEEKLYEIDSEIMNKTRLDPERHNQLNECGIM